jgi:CO/xanthine dehydrogenase FAD-binding subunit
MLNLKEYHRPRELTEALALLQRKQTRTAVLSGGTWLVGEAPPDVEAVVDIADLGLTRILVEGSLVRIGAGVTHQQLVENDVLGAGALRVIGQTAHAMSSLNIRNRATIAGAIVTADAASPLVTALLACDAEVVIAGARDKSGQTNGLKVLPLPGFLAYRQQILSEGVLITEVRMPLPSSDTRSHYARVARTPRDYPIVCAVAAFAMKDGIAGRVRVALGGVAPTPIRLNQLEFGLEKKALADWLDRELDAQMALIEPVGDWLGSAEYRKEMARVLVRRAILAIAA